MISTTRERAATTLGGPGGGQSAIRRHSPEQCRTPVVALCAPELA